MEKIIAAYSGTGKTTFASMHPLAVIDFVCMPYKYYLEPDGDQSEACKANFDNIMREDWPYNYIYAIKQTMKSGKILVIPSDLTVLDLLYLEGLPYILCYPQRSEKEAYRNRFAARGNTDNFIDVFIGKWDWFLDAQENDQHSKHIVLGPNQFLSDVIRIGSTSSSDAGGWDIMA